MQRPWVHTCAFGQSLELPQVPAMSGSGGASTGNMSTGGERRAR